MEPELQAEHPEIRTYAGRGRPRHQHPARRHADRLPRHGPPSRRRDLARRPGPQPWARPACLSYRAAPMGAAPEAFVEKQLRERRSNRRHAPRMVFSSPGGAVTQRTFRMAFLTDPSYATYFGSTASHAVRPAVSPRRPR